MEPIISPNPWMIIPFGLLLASIAFCPLWVPHWWHRHYPKVALALGAVTIGYYLGILRANHRVLEVAHEYFSFIVLIGSLFVVAGGIHLTVKGQATPAKNVMLLGVGAIISNLLGTTGASMLLIRPWIRMNRYRITAHHVVFFIFIVSNVGGALTPIGDPPLFLGYLKGVPFWWVAQHCWGPWVVAVGLLLLIFYCIDLRNYRRAPKTVRDEVAEPADEWKVEGLFNLVFLAVILGATFASTIPFLREGLMIAAALASWKTTSEQVHRANQFDLGPLKEVVILFVGIFATMIPALDWLMLNAARLGTPSAGVFYWSCGGLSSVLDNAPTYLSFLYALFGLFIPPEALEGLQQALQAGNASGLTGPYSEQIRQAFAFLQTQHPAALATGQITSDQAKVAFLLVHPESVAFMVSISLGAVFFGAMTYIGNGPNFMVKAIAAQSQVHAPTFLGYLFKYSLPFLLPVLVVVWLIFLR